MALPQPMTVTTEAEATEPVVLPPPGVAMSSSGSLEVRLAADPQEIAAAQALRYRVFYEEMGAEPTEVMRRDRRDFDPIDAYCDHLLVLDHTRPAAEAVVGTYRLLRHEVARDHGGYYSSSEYDLHRFLANVRPQDRLLELGRSCVDADYRTNATIQLLWRGIVAYNLAHQITYMFGCASFGGTDPDAIAMPLSYLHYEFPCPAEIAVRAKPELYVPMNRLPREQVDMRAALRATPPLIKGYLRLGAHIGDGAVIDRQFRTTDCFILLPVARIRNRYHTHLGRKPARPEV
ncbi:GNAT family N-acetyltransferase [Zavarzinia sp. CC-PAN008]|uniref:GNAT family N-acetyltransferase n=1 Tax=Zavarzinia sp. CC-PAN008 TaxID=3243332 RepID=UPI003F74AA10